MAIIGDVVPARQRSKYQAVLGIVATVALIAGALLGGLFTDDLSWRWIFYLNIPVGIAAVIAVAAFLHLPARAASTSPAPCWRPGSPWRSCWSRRGAEWPTDGARR
jgi:MFS family permease